MTRSALQARIYDALAQVDDPCMCLAGKGLSILDMGIVNSAVIKDGVALISLTFTDPMCLFEFRITNEVVDRVSDLPGVRDVKIVIDHLPIWTSDRLSDKARQHFAEERASFAARLILQAETQAMF